MHRDKKYTEGQDGERLQAFPRSSGPLNPALRLAALHGVVPSVQLHVERKDPLDGRDQNGHTALMIAARRNHHEVCTLLLQAGADPDLQDNDGLTALDLAKSAKATDAYAKLVEFNQSRGQLVSEPKAARLTEDPPEPIHESGLLPGKAISLTRDGAEEDTALGAWEPLTETAPPEDDKGLRDRASQTQAAIDKHIPLDPLAMSWDEVSAYLPEQLHSGALSEAIEKGVRAAFLRGLREGSVPSLQIDSLLEDEDPLVAGNIKLLANQVMQDLGAELDERIEALGVFEDHRVWPTGVETDEEQQTLDDAIEHLVSLLQPKNDPGLLFARKAYGLPLLSQAEEVEIAKEMEQALENAEEVLSRWSEGLSILLKKCAEVESGGLALKLVQGRNKSGIDELNDADSEDEAHSHMLGPGQRSKHSIEDEDEPDSDEPQSADELKEFLSQANLLRALISQPIGDLQSTSNVRAVLDEMCLSGTFLCSLEQRSSRQPEAIEFTRHISRFLKARDLLILSNLKLVVPMVKRFMGTGAEFSDLLQEGHIGLIRAADKFDWRRGFKFSTMATWWIRQQVSRAAPEHARLIRLPVHGVEVTWEMKRLLSKYLDQHDHPPSVRWLALQLGLSELKTESYLRTISEPLPLEVLESNPWLPTPDDTDPLAYVSRMECAEKVEKLLQHLGSQPGGKMSEKVLRMRYCIGTREDMTLDEIGRRFNLTRERIRQIETKATRLLQGHVRAMLSREMPSSDKATASFSETKNVTAVRTENESLAQPLGSDRRTTIGSDGDPKQLDRASLQRTKSLPPAKSQRPFTERQLELLHRAKAIGIGVLTYLESGRYETLVMLPHRRSQPERELAAELLAAGFSFRPGHGYYV